MSSLGSAGFGTMISLACVIPGSVWLSRPRQHGGGQLNSLYRAAGNSEILAAGLASGWRCGLVR